MPRPKGSQNKITSEIKDKLQLLIDDLIASLNVNELEDSSNSLTIFFTKITSQDD